MSEEFEQSAIENNSFNIISPFEVNHCYCLLYIKLRKLNNSAVTKNPLNIISFFEVYVTVIALWCISASLE